MQLVDIFESVIDFNPEVTRELFDLDLAASRDALDPKAHKKFRQFLFQHKNDNIRLYHGTSDQHDVMNQGLLPTSAKRRLSLQSGSGYVYLSYDPRRALSFATYGYPGQQRYVVYAVTVPIRKLKPDPDQLRNKRMWGERPDIGSSLADSLIYGSGARVQGRIEPWQISVYGYFDRDGHPLES
jgi:hypothetical protein